jgi:bifunctional DNA-binding transcriptional regulator/antitoxin component of YhaV-PrlF toxin-antitoxin module
MSDVKDRRSGATISSKNQITIPVDALRAAGLRAGDRLRTREIGPGRIVLELDHDPLDDLAGALSGLYRSGELDALRDEWR